MSRPSIGIVGGGTMGAGIAYVFAVADGTVQVVEPSAPQRARLVSVIDDALANAVKRGKLSDPEATAARDRITVIESVGHLTQNADLVVETVPELLELKQQVLQGIEVMEPLMLATNTSALSIDLLAGSLADPGRFIGMHFFNPVWSLHLVELIRGQATTETTINRATALVKTLGKESILVRDVPGFATSRLDMGAALEAMRMLEDGVASAEDIDRAAVLAYRHPVGPLRLSDIVGLDVRLDIASTLEQSHGPRFSPPQILIDKVAAGQLGEKSGQGFHLWPQEPKKDT